MPYIESFEDLRNRYEEVSTNLREELEGNIPVGDKSDYLKKINCLGRDLTGLVVYAYKFPDFFSDERIEEALGLIRNTADYLRGLGFPEDNGAYEDRENHFENQVRLSLEVVQKERNFQPSKDRS